VVRVILSYLLLTGVLFSFCFCCSSGVIEGMSDGDRFRQTSEALDIIGMSDTETSELLSAVSGVLHLGQVRPKQNHSCSPFEAIWNLGRRLACSRGRCAPQSRSDSNRSSGRPSIRIVRLADRIRGEDKNGRLSAERGREQEITE